MAQRGPGIALEVRLPDALLVVLPPNVRPGSHSHPSDSGSNTSHAASDSPPCSYSREVPLFRSWNCHGEKAPGLIPSSLSPPNTKVFPGSNHVWSPHGMAVYLGCSNGGASRFQATRWPRKGTAVTFNAVLGDQFGTRHHACMQALGTRKPRTSLSRMRLGRFRISLDED